MCLSLSTLVALSLARTSSAVPLPLPTFHPLHSSSPASSPSSLVHSLATPSTRPLTAMERPTSSRPFTSSGSDSARPNTSHNRPDYYFYRDQQDTVYSQDYTIDEEDEESEAEDVFAFGPPATADSDAMPGSAVPLHSEVVQPLPTYDPHGGFNAYNVAGPSSLHPRHPYPLSPQVESPPSTDSQAGDDPYRMRRIPDTAITPTTVTRTGTTHTGGRSAVSSAVSSREVHISLPRTKDRIEEEQAEDPQKSRPPSSATSLPSSDSAAASIK